MDVTPTARDLGEGVWQFQAPLWQTNSLLAVAGNEAVVVDPAFSPTDIETVRAEAKLRAEGPLHLLVTHGDFDHVCGIGFFSEADVIGGEETARRIEDGSAAEELRAAGPEWGVSWPSDELRVDRVVGPEGEFACGAFRVAAVDAPSHGREGLGYVLLEHGVLVPGDHLSAVTYPLLAGSLARAADACRRLLEALDRHHVRWVVPGHGPALTSEEAKEIGEADLAYLERLQAAARQAYASELSPGYAVLHVYAVEPPRATTDDFEIYNIRAGNARQAVAELDRAAAAEA